MSAKVLTFSKILQKYIGKPSEGQQFRQIFYEHKNPHSARQSGPMSFNVIKQVKLNMSTYLRRPTLKTEKTTTQ